MRDFKLLIKVKKLYQETFDPPEDKIDFISFLKFPLLSFRLIFFDLQPLSETATSRMKIKYFTRKCLNWFCVLTLFFVPLQFIGFGANSEDFDLLVRAISDASTAVLIIFKSSALFLRKDDIRMILEELKVLFEIRDSCSEDLRKRKYLDEYHRAVKAYGGNFIFANLITTILWIPYLLIGREGDLFLKLLVSI